MTHLVPQPPGWRVPWEAIEDHLACSEAMRECEQEQEYHGEGDVWTHTRMVCEVLASMAKWRELPALHREILFAAALLHDCAKPECARIDNGRIRHTGHAPTGAIRARRWLWEMDWPVEHREAVAALVRHHMEPHRLLHRADERRTLHYISQTARCDWLAMLAEADARGRICRDAAALLESIELFRELALEERCLNAPREFASPHSRFLYFHKEDRDPEYRAFDDTRCELILLSGLPGAGKDTWISNSSLSLPVISLDGLREEKQHSAHGLQGAVIAAAREQARTCLRSGQSFIWNATNLSHEIRAQVINLAAAYRTRIRIVAVEAPAGSIYVRNQQRTRPVPAAAIDRMLQRWQIPDLTEAHSVEYAVMAG